MKIKETQVINFFNALLTNLMWFFLGAFVGGVIGALVIYFGAWSVMAIGGVVALGLHITDKEVTA